MRIMHSVLQKVKIKTQYKCPLCEAEAGREEECYSKLQFHRESDSEHD